MSLLAVLAATAIILLAVMWHELGHYWAARACGVRPTQFSIGFGSTLWSTTRRSVEWRVAWLPLGGSVKLPEGLSQDTSVSLPRQAAIYVAGPMANYVAAALLLVGLYSFYPRLDHHPAEGVVMPAAVVGMTYAIIPSAIANGAKDFDGPVGMAKTGGGIIEDGQALRTEEHPETPPLWVRTVVWAAVVNLGLLAINLFPIPILDGGRLLFAGISGIGSWRAKRPWRLPEEVEGLILALSAIPVIVLFGFITFHDIFS